MFPGFFFDLVSKAGLIDFENQNCAEIDLQYQIDPNTQNIFMAVFIDLSYSPLNSAKLSCLSEVTLLLTHNQRKPRRLL